MARYSLACRATDATIALVRGQVSLRGVDLCVTEENDVVKIFAGMFRGEYDIAEMSLAELIYYTSRGRCDFIGIPVFPSRLFRHGFLFCRRSAGVREPGNLSGKKIGALRWVQTAFIWLRGMLADRYGVSPGRTQWYVSALHHWQEHGTEDAITPRNGAVVRRFTRAGTDDYDVNCRALIDGEIDALMTTENRKYDRLAQEPSIRRVFRDARAAEADYFRATGILPIMHVLVVRRAIAQRHPELPERLFELFCRSKRVGREWIRSTPSLTLAWKDAYLESEREVFHGDPWAYGLEKNLPTLNTFLSYCHDEGVSARTVAAHELFAPSTWELAE